MKERIGEVAYKARQKENQRRWKAKNPGYFRAKRGAYKDVVRAYVRGLKSEPCTDCGVSYPYYVMQFDHIRDDKVLGVSKAKSIKEAQAEIAKCELVCANCHAERTYQRGQVERESRQAKLGL